MVSLTPELLGGSIIFVGIGYLIALVFSVYQLYLNWKQSKVMDTQKEQIEILKEIRDLLRQ